MVSSAGDGEDVLAIIADHLGREVQRSDVLLDFVDDSLDLVSLVMELDRVFEVSDVGLGSVLTVQDLIYLCARR